MRQRIPYTATMDAKLLAKLDLAKGSVPRSAWVESAVRLGLELVEDMKTMKERYDQASRIRGRPEPR